jgi:hypothetical protein
MKLAIALAAALAVGPVPALTTAGNVITLTDEERVDCEAGGGCVVLPVDALKAKTVDLMRGAFEAGQRDARASCKGST